LVAGDTLFCLGGQYDLKSTVSFTKNGTAQKKVCIYNYPGEKPIFDFRKMAYGSRGIQVKEGSNYVHIKGLTIRYTGKNGLHNSGSHCTFEQLDVYGNGDTGIQMKAGGDNTIINCDSHDNFDYKLANDFGGNADGFADKQYTGGTNT
ncbi:MAG: right-handed parallel beta-helix repeat-containing protein, partial [Prevotella sp.]|nr:right-handed parallel beta-helix repeat-containing protein [Prevotella sp.]